jgi:hypothetical protein
MKPRATTDSLTPAVPLGRQILDEKERGMLGMADTRLRFTASGMVQFEGASDSCSHATIRLQDLGSVGNWECRDPALKAAGTSSFRGYLIETTSRSNAVRASDKEEVG